MSLLLAPTVQFPVMLIPFFEDDKGIPGHSSGVPIPGHTSSCDSDDTIEIDVIREIPWCTACGHTMEAAEILATLAADGDSD